MTEKDEEEQCVNWSNMLPELLTEMIQRVEAREGSWPGRKMSYPALLFVKAGGILPRRLSKHLIRVGS